MTKPKPAAQSAPLIWQDDWNVYLEWPGYAQRFPITEGGRSKIFKFIPHVKSLAGYVSVQSNIVDKLVDTRKAKIARKTKAKRAIAQATDKQIQSGMEALRRLRMKQP